MNNRAVKLCRFTFGNRALIANFIILFVLLIFIMPPGNWHDNEEQYLGYAWRTFSPEDIAQISALRDPSNHRFLFDTLVGFSIHHLGFQWTHALGRTIVALLYSASLVLLFKNLGLSIAASCTTIVIFVSLGETILGGEWLFRSFEPKTLAYPFILFSFSSSLKRRFSDSYLLLVPATYFHFLIGGFWFFITGLCEFYSTRSLKRVLLDSLRYFIACIPLFVAIGLAQLQSQNSAVNSIPSANWIYSIYRNPHHVSPFSSLGQFISWYENGIIFLFGLMLVSVILYRSSENDVEKEFSRLIICLNLYLILVLLVSWFDKDGVLGKYYLFRPSSIILLLTLCLYALFLKNRFLRNASSISVAALVIAGCFFLPKLPMNAIIIHRVVSAFVGKEKPGLSEVQNHDQLDTIIRSSNIADVFLIDYDLELSYLSFERQFNRPTLVAKKFVPTTASDIIRWYDLLNRKQELFRHGCPDKIIEEYPIKYLLAKSDKQSVMSCGKELFIDKNVRLIEIPHS